MLLLKTGLNKNITACTYYLQIINEHLECVIQIHYHNSGVMCRSRYQKVKNLFPVGVAQEIQTDSFSLTKETQTDPVLPVIEKQ